MPRGTDMANSRSYNGGGDRQIVGNVIEEFEAERPLVDAGVKANEDLQGVSWVNNGVIAAGSDVVLPIYVAPVDCTLVGVRFVDSDGVVADGTNFIAIRIINKGQAGVGTLPLATFDSNTGGAGQSLAVLIAHKINLDPTVDINEGDVLALETTNGGAGQALDNFMVQLLVAPRAI